MSLYSGSSSRYKRSDAMSDRHPVLPESLPNASLEVSEAFGTRSVSKLSDLLRSSLLSEAESLLALQLIVEQLYTTAKQIEAIKAGVLDIALSMFQSSPTNERARLQAAKAISAQSNFRPLEGFGGVCAAATSPDSVYFDLLVQGALNDTSAAVRHACAVGVVAALRSRAGAAEAIDRPDIVANIVQSLSQQANTVILRAITCLSSSSSAISSSSSSSAASVLLQAGAMPALIGFLATEPTDEAQVLDCLGALRNLVGDGGDAGKEAAFSSGVIPYLATRLDHHHQSPEVVRMACGIAASLTIYLPAKRALIALGPHVYVPRFIACLHSPDPLTSSTAMIAIRHFAEVSDARGAFLTALLSSPPTISRVFGPSVADELLNVVDDDEKKKSQSQTDRALALEALVLLCSPPLIGSGVEAIADAINGGIRILVRVARKQQQQPQQGGGKDHENHQSPAMEQAAVQLLHLVAARNDGLKKAIVAEYEHVGAVCTLFAIPPPTNTAPHQKEGVEVSGVVAGEQGEVTAITEEASTTA